MDFRGITIGILNSRDKWIDECISSATRQYYPPEFYDIHVEANLEKQMTIGAGYNKIVREAKYDWIFFLGDDDMITRTYLFNLNAFIDGVKEQHPDADIVSATTYLTVIDSTKRLGIDVAPQGMWRKDFLLKNPFDETLERYVDTDLFNRVNEMEDNMIILDKTNHGYFYRQHDNNISANKFEAKTQILDMIEEKFGRNRLYA